MPDPQKTSLRNPFILLTLAIFSASALVACWPPDPPQPEPKGRVFAGPSCVDVNSTAKVYTVSDSNTVGAQEVTPDTEVGSATVVADTAEVAFAFEPEDCCQFIFEGVKNSTTFQEVFSCPGEPFDEDYECQATVCSGD